MAWHGACAGRPAACCLRCRRSGRCFMHVLRCAQAWHRIMACSQPAPALHPLSVRSSRYPCSCAPQRDTADVEAGFYIGSPPEGQAHHLVDALAAHDAAQPSASRPAGEGLAQLPLVGKPAADLAGLLASPPHGGPGHRRSLSRHGSGLSRLISKNWEVRSVRCAALCCDAVPCRMGGASLRSLSGIVAAVWLCCAQHGMASPAAAGVPPCGMLPPCQLVHLPRLLPADGCAGDAAGCGRRHLHLPCGRWVGN